MLASLKVRVIGLSRMGQLYSRLLATRIAEATLYAIAEVDTSARQRVTDEFSVPHAYLEAEEMLTRPELDAVIIATPTSTHDRLVIAATRAGKAIFCEKPLALTVEGTQAVIEAVAQARVPPGALRRCLLRPIATFCAMFTRWKKAVCQRRRCTRSLHDCSSSNAGLSDRTTCEAR